MTAAKSLACSVCGKLHPAGNLRALSALGSGVTAILRAETPGLEGGSLICRADQARARRLYLEKLLEAERGEISKLDRDVLASFETEAMITTDPDSGFEVGRTFGQRAADVVAAFGGSWRFILIFMGILVVWMAVNATGFLLGTFDPYPFILLNLVLSCVAALQAPIIMMSQRRTEAKDRRRAENDYKVNLKAELEIRHLHEKLDHQMARQWERLAAIQAMQIAMMEDAAREDKAR